MLMRMFDRILRLMSAAALGALAILPLSEAQSPRPAVVKSVRLYVLDCGVITGVSGAGFGFKDGDLATTDMVTPCFLIVHPRGTLMWDTGEIPDNLVKTDGTPTKQGAFTVTRPLLPQLAAIGYTPANITYLALSHYHTDHVANANAFAKTSTWLVQQVERDAMFAERPANEKKGPGAPNSAMYSELKNAKTTILKNEDHDVFGDGTVVIKFTPGHTPGHQSLFLKLAKTGPVLLSGDLYHYPEEIAAHKAPSFDFNQDETFRSRAAMEAFIKQNHAQLWIQHDATAGKTRKIAPEYYE